MVALRASLVNAVLPLSNDNCPASNLVHRTTVMGRLEPAVTWGRSLPVRLNFRRRLTGAAVNWQSRPFAGTDVWLVWSRSVDDPEVVGIYGVFDLDLEHCPKCGGELKIIAAILVQSVIEKILVHLGLDPRPSPSAPAPSRWNIKPAEPQCGTGGRVELPAESAGRCQHQNQPPE